MRPIQANHWVLSFGHYTNQNLEKISIFNITFTLINIFNGFFLFLVSKKNRKYNFRIKIRNAPEYVCSLYLNVNEMRLQILNRIAAMSKSNGWFTKRTIYETKVAQYKQRQQSNMNTEIIYLICD